MKKLNILHIVNVRFFNATAWYAMQVSKKLCELGHNSTVLTLEGEEADIKAIEMNIPRIALPFDQKKVKNLPKIMQFLKKVIEKQKPDIVNCHRGELFPLFIYLKKKYGFKLVRTRGDQRFAKNTFLNRYFYSTVSDAVVATNSRIKNNLNEKLNVPQAKLSMIIGGVDTRNFYPNITNREETRASFGYTSQDKVIGLLGRLDPIKGQIETIIALAKALYKNEKAKNLKLCIIGFDEVSTSKELYDLAEKHNIKDKVLITGKVANVNDVLNMCDAAILSSIGSEAIARAALEFIACEIPLISSNIGVMPDLLEANARFNTGDTDDMAEFLIRLSLALDDTSSKEYIWLEELKRSQKDKLADVTLDKFAEKTLKVYTNIYK